MPPPPTTAPPTWRERARDGQFVATLAKPPADAFPLVFAALIGVVGLVAWYVAPQGSHFKAGDVEMLLPLTSLLIALGFSSASAFALFSDPSFVVADGRFVFRHAPLPRGRAVECGLADIERLRPVERVVEGKRSTYKVWDLEVAMRDGTARRVELAFLSRDEVAWIADRLSARFGA